MRVMLETCMNQIVCSEGIDFKVRFFVDRFCHTCEMKYLINSFHSILERIPLIAITIDIIAGRIFEIKAPPAIIWIFDVFILWSAFGPMSKKITPKNDDNKKQAY